MRAATGFAAPSPAPCSLSCSACETLCGPDIVRAWVPCPRIWRCCACGDAVEARVQLLEQCAERLERRRAGAAAANVGHRRAARCLVGERRREARGIGGNGE